MNVVGILHRELRAAREQRTVALNTAVFRINARLVLDTVLGEVVKSARPLAPDGMSPQLRARSAELCGPELRRKNHDENPIRVRHEITAALSGFGRNV